MESMRKKRVYNKSHAEIILRVENYFENEKLNPELIDVHKVVEKTTAACGVHRSLVSKIKMRKMKYEEGAKLLYETSMQVPEKYEALVRTVVRDLFLKKERIPTIDIIWKHLKELSFDDISHFNLFEDETAPSGGLSVWPWCRMTLYTFMRSIGYVYREGSC